MDSKHYIIHNLTLVNILVSSSGFLNWLWFLSWSSSQKCKWWRSLRADIETNRIERMCQNMNQLFQKVRNLIASRVKSIEMRRSRCRWPSRWFWAREESERGSGCEMQQLLASSLTADASFWWTGTPNRRDKSWEGAGGEMWQRFWKLLKNNTKSDNTKWIKNYKGTLVVIIRRINFFLNLFYLLIASKKLFRGTGSLNYMKF